MSEEKCIILGAGSQAKVLIDLIRAAEALEAIGAIDLGASGKLVGQSVMGLPVLGTLADLQELRLSTGANHAGLAIGDNELRQKAYQAALEAEFFLIDAIHPSAIQASGAEIGQGSTLSAQSFLGVDAQIGVGCILNTASGVDHDGKLGDFVHIAVGARLAGNVTVGDFTTIGAGATIIPGIRIGKNVTIGAGAVVTKDIPDGVTAIGVPARF